MANSGSLAILLLSISALLIATVEADHAPPPNKTIEAVVEGMVYCQSCNYPGTWNLAGAKPIASAKVSVICKNHHHHVTFYKVFETDKDGYFYGELKGYSPAPEYWLLDHPLHACRVKLVSSPLDNCGLLSNINYGMYGAKLRFDDKRLISPDHGYEAVIYSAGPLAFRPTNCPPPSRKGEDDSSETHD